MCGTSICQRCDPVSDRATVSMVQRGHRFNPNKLFSDPYAKALQHPQRWSDAMFGY